MNRPCRVLQIAAAMFALMAFVAAVLALVAFAGSARADIFQWEYINPADPSQGKQQSTTLCPDGAGVDAVPGAELLFRNLTMAYLSGADLTGATGDYANLTNADLRQANLTNAYLLGATLTDADFTGAEVQGASFYAATYNDGFMAAQLYSTASYQAHDLTGINLGFNDLTGWNFAGQNLTNAHFGLSTLTGTDFTNAEVRGASFRGYYYYDYDYSTRMYVGGLTLAQLYSTASYQARDLTGINFGINDLSGRNFAGQNLTNAAFRAATLTDADFTGAQVRGADFGISARCGPDGPCIGTGITLAQLYSTASYQAHDLSGIGLQGNNLAGGNFAGQNLTNTNFIVPLLGDNANLTAADLTAADARGADLYLEFQSNVITTNLILHDGHITGLELDDGGLLVVRDYDGDPNNYDVFGNPIPNPIPLPPIPITVDERLAMGPGGRLRMVFEVDAWDSTISFAPGIPVTLGGTLELTFASDMNPASQVGRTFDLFDWTGVNPTGTFAISSPYAWDLSNLYTTGEVTLTAVPEPACIALAAAGAFGLTFYRRRKNP